MSPSKKSSPSTPSFSGPSLWKHQLQTLQFLETRKRAIDGSDPGTGKTAPQVLHYARRKDRKRCLIVCPKTLMVAAWLSDFETFAPHISVALAYSTQREEAFAMGTDVVVINTDGVKWLLKNKHLLKDFDHLVIDEFTDFKDPGVNRAKAMSALRKYFDYRYLLSGTGNPNTVMELWHPLLLCDDGKRLGTSYSRLRNSVQVPRQVGPAANHIRWEDRPGVIDTVYELISDIVIRHDFDEVMQHVPPNFRESKKFKLSPRAMALYDKMEAEYILSLDDGNYVNAVHAASLRTKLLQIASGAVYNANGGYTLIDTARYELVADLIEKVDHSVVFFNWAHQRDELIKEFTARKYTFALIDGSVTKKGERDQIVRDYQAGKYKTILLHPKTGAHGLTLTRGTTTVFTSPIYEADRDKQAIKRIHRGSQDKPTRTIYIEAEGTVEQLVVDRRTGKATNMNDMLNLMKQRNKN